MLNAIFLLLLCDSNPTTTLDGPIYSLVSELLARPATISKYYVLDSSLLIKRRMTLLSLRHRWNTSGLLFGSFEDDYDLYVNSSIIILI
jgi:hypothetical protein